VSALILCVALWQDAPRAADRVGDVDLATKLAVTAAFPKAVLQRGVWMAKEPAGDGNRLDLLTVLPLIRKGDQVVVAVLQRSDVRRRAEKNLAAFRPIKPGAASPAVVFVRATREGTVRYQQAGTLDGEAALAVCHEARYAPWVGDGFGTPQLAVTYEGRYGSARWDATIEWDAVFDVASMRMVKRTPKTLVKRLHSGRTTREDFTVVQTAAPDGTKLQIEGLVPAARGSGGQSSRSKDFWCRDTCVVPAALLLED
jgi:hypothetical protein